MGLSPPCLLSPSPLRRRSHLSERAGPPPPEIAPRRRLEPPLRRSTRPHLPAPPRASSSSSSPSGASPLRRPARSRCLFYRRPWVFSLPLPPLLPPEALPAGRRRLPSPETPSPHLLLPDTVAAPGRHCPIADGSGARDGTIAQMCQVVRQEGWQRLYGGLAPSLVGTAASQGVYYYFYQIFRTRAENAALDHWRRGLGDGSVGMFQSLVAAALSGCMNVLMTNPIWVVVTRMQTHTKTRSKQPSQPLPIGPDAEILTTAIKVSQYGTSHAVQEVYGEAGIWGFWKGVFPTLIMVANPSIQFMLYETLLKKLKQRRATNTKGADGVTALEIFLLGALAKLGATVVTYPLLVVKSRLQAKQVTSSDKRHHYRGTLDAIAKMIKYEGLSGFYRGMSTKIVQSVLAAAVLFMVKEELVKGARLLVTGNASLVGISTAKPRQ